MNYFLSAPSARGHIGTDLGKWHSLPRGKFPQTGAHLSYFTLIHAAPRSSAMHDFNDSIRSLTKRICAFRDARDWQQFHSPKDLAVAISAEAGELLQHFVWQSSEQSHQRALERKPQIAAEMADVAILLLEMAEVTGISLGDAIEAKLTHNSERYPVAKARGSNKKYTEL